MSSIDNNKMQTFQTENDELFEDNFNKQSFGISEARKFVNFKPVQNQNIIIPNGLQRPPKVIHNHSKFTSLGQKHMKLPPYKSKINQKYI